MSHAGFGGLEDPNRARFTEAGAQGRLQFLQSRQRRQRGVKQRHAAVEQHAAQEAVEREPGVDLRDHCPAIGRVQEVGAEGAGPIRLVGNGGQQFALCRRQLDHPGKPGVLAMVRDDGDDGAVDAALERLQFATCSAVTPNG